MSKSRGKPYYYNHATREKSWAFPASAAGTTAAAVSERRRREGEKGTSSQTGGGDASALSPGSSTPARKPVRADPSQLKKRKRSNDVHDNGREKATLERQRRDGSESASKSSNLANTRDPTGCHRGASTTHGPAATGEAQAQGPASEKRRPGAIAFATGDQNHAGGGRGVDNRPAWVAKNSAGSAKKVQAAGKEGRGRGEQHCPIGGVPPANRLDAHSGGTLRQLTLRKVYIHQIRNGAKTVEGRINSGMPAKVRVGDTMRFFYMSNASDDVFCRVEGVRSYPSFADMLEHEGHKACVPEQNSFDSACRLYESIPGYKDRAAQHGVLAIRLTVVDGAALGSNEPSTHPQQRGGGEHHRHQQRHDRRGECNHQRQSSTTHERHPRQTQGWR